MDWGQFCPDCGGVLSAVKVAAPQPPISVAKGPTGTDYSLTNVHSTAHTTSNRDDHSFRDDHSVKTANKHDHSSHATTFKTNTDNRVKHSRVNIGGGLLMFFSMIAALGFAMWVINRQAVQTPNSSEVTSLAGSSGAAGPAQAAPSRTTPEQPSQLTAGGRRESPPPLLPSPAAGSSSGASTEPATQVVKLDRTKYLNVGSIHPGLVSVLMVDERRGLDALLTQQVAVALGGSDDLFKPAFVGDGLFSRVHRGDIDLLRELAASTEISEVILGTRAVTFTAIEVSGTAMTRASVTLSIRVTRPSSGFVSNTQAAQEIGAGFDEAGALTAATDNALKKLLKQMGK
jgi:hypothetical protein